MKRHLILSAAALLCLTACAQNSKKMNENKTLIAWFSWSGNTEAVVNHIAEVTGADTFRIERESPIRQNTTLAPWMRKMRSTTMFPCHQRPPGEF
jgi:hypothetical protein